MGKYSFFDEADKIIAIDISGLTLTQTVLDQLAFEVKELTETLPFKVFAIIKWQNVKIPADLNDLVGKTFGKLLEYVQGLVRYETDEPTPFRIVEAGPETYVSASSPKSKAAALASVRVLESGNKPQKLD